MGVFCVWCEYMSRDERVGDAVYQTQGWKRLRHQYFTSQHGICERCNDSGTIVHHTIYITKENVNNPNITMNADLLELLCHDCHNKEHYRTDEPIKEGYGFDDNGNFIETF